MVTCEHCGEIMTSAPSHMEHRESCVRTRLWETIDRYVLASGGDPLRGRSGRGAAQKAIDRILREAGR
jgi:hypothetical protein